MIQPFDRSRRARFFSRLRARALLIFGLSTLAILCLLWSIIAIPLPRVMPMPQARRLGRLAITGGFRWYIDVLTRLGAFRFDLSELDALRQAPPLIIAANHPCLLDAVMILSRLPNVSCILKAKLWNNPLFGAGARLAGYIRNDAPVAMIKAAVQELKNGSHMLVFPEGTRTTHPPLNPLKSSTGLIAVKAGVPVQVVFIEINSPFLGKDWPLLRCPSVPIVCRVRLGRRITPPHDVRGFMHDLETCFQAGLSAVESDGGCETGARLEKHGGRT
ncbi:1-acyl-sn-glycerol-3-phosphate acyltransferase [Candidatus Methylospira mobilis]|uniref:1-acyl-sn-glycerol-3-phosphate acyltransferase n=1 Tax=Candidatus Methylospira mobilis TaxID=1808979 RepID=A0A5Q0BHQ8_9GAMM|nr:lysophospholipid acyltransferase family protein [Candidatus Methylospira mobilis]QFY41356.1 1-acyl-sn-glycerol-3-phosphate acyltransferase [Candidatus Methylospira mobilis]WNV05419.1 lysophospholipid acyltransferase family protein [Candidatus Methylospira mobilis]